MIEPLLSDDAFLKDVEHQSRQAYLKFNVWWLGQSGYLLHFGADRILIDPYLSDSLTEKYALTDKPHVRMSRRVIDPGKLPKVDAITSSHQHTDHLDAATVLPLIATSPSAKIIVPRAIAAFAGERLNLPLDRLTTIDDGQCVRVGGVEIWAVPAAHPELERDEQGACRYLGYVFRSQGWTIYHSGDTLAFDELAVKLSPYAIDVAILPINGKLGNMDAKAAAIFAKRINARIAIPCHYDMFEFNTAPPVSFEMAARQLGVQTRVLRLGERLGSHEVSR